MGSDRYVLLGLAPARSPWFRALTQWANSSSVPVEFTKCMSTEELRARLASNRAHSAVLVDGHIAGLDRDLVGLADEVGCPTLIVGGDRQRFWLGLGARAVLRPDFSRQEFLDVLGLHARPIAQAEATVYGPESEEPLFDRASIIAVCGPGGTGASTLAIAAAQAMAHQSEPEAPRRPGLWRVRGDFPVCLGPPSMGPGLGVVLVDLARRGEQAMLHDSKDVIPGIQELVEAHRHSNPTTEMVRSMAFEVTERGYHLVLGLRKAWGWPAIPPRAFRACLAGLARSYSTVVCDIDADFEGEADCGSGDVEDRNLMARDTALKADLVLAVGSAGMKGTHSLGRVLNDLDHLGVDAQRVLPLINRAPRAHRARAELSSALGMIVDPEFSNRMASAVFVPDRPVEEALRDGVALPDSLAQPLGTVITAIMARVALQPSVALGPEAIKPGSLGHWGLDEMGLASR
ncbi:MAG: hypothetical protein ACYCS7_06635 [Acidimicrobiales bacterium]